MRPGGRAFFWASALAAAALFAALAGFLLPHEALRLESGAARGRAWLLTVWTSGVMCVLFGAAGLAGFVGSVGFREVAEAGSLSRALEARRQARRQAGGAGYAGNFAAWLVCTGAFLLAAYFAGWLALRG